MASDLRQGVQLPAAVTPACGACAGDFTFDYELGTSPAVRALEQRVLGRAYGGTSWTTPEEARWFVQELRLAAGVRLLDVGSGAGWPALFFAQASGCDAVLVDLPPIAMRIARERAVADGVAARCAMVAGDGAALPFADAAFDAISHADVLCCTPHKAAMLRECRRVARPGARMVFSVLLLAPALAGAARELAIAGGPPFVDTETAYEALLAQAGWSVVLREDVSAEFTRLAALNADATDEAGDGLRAVMGREQFEWRLQKRRAAQGAARAGVLLRQLFVAVAAPQ